MSGTHILRFEVALLFVSLMATSHAQTDNGDRSLDHDSARDTFLGFGAARRDLAPDGWHVYPAGAVVVDDRITHSGHESVRIEKKAGSSNLVSSLSKTLPMESSGTTIQLKGFLRCEDVTGFAGLWMREDEDGDAVEFASMEKANPLKGTADWSEFSVSVRVHPGAQEMVIGGILSGPGKVWISDLRLLVDGNPLARPPGAIPHSVMSQDRQFDGGSGIHLSELSEIQIENLTMLGKVWGFLKYYHPTVTSGERQWDYELFRDLPSVLAAPDKVSAQRALLHMVRALGPLNSCRLCASMTAMDLQLPPDLTWIGDHSSLGADLSDALIAIRQNRLPEKQFYVSLVEGVKNPLFEHERIYMGVRFPDAGFQILALFRFWNIIEYWSPYRNLLTENWDDVLRRFLPQIALAQDSDAYQRELMLLIANVHDSHTNLWSSLSKRPPVGECQLPIKLRFIEDSPVVVGYPSADRVANPDFEIGDVILDLDHVPVQTLIKSWTPYYAASNDAARMRDITWSMTKGQCGPTSVGIRRRNETINLQTMRIRVSDKQPVSFEHDLPGGAFQLLSDRIAYLKLSSVQAFDIPRYLDIAKNTDGLIVDIRNYPSDFVVFALGSHLVYQLTNFARFTNGDLSNPGAFYWTGPESLTPKIPNYQGKIVILVDEVTVSQAEYTAMALRASPRAVVIGSTTAGADGNVSDVPLPGGLHTLISGIGVYYPDRRPTQQIGIQPDIIVKPTINGIRAGRDEILEAAIRHIAGSNAPICAIEKLIREREREASRDLETHSQQSSREQRSKGDPEFGTSISSEPCSVQ